MLGREGGGIYFQYIFFNGNPYLRVSFSDSSSGAQFNKTKIVLIFPDLTHPQKMFSFILFGLAPNLSLRTLRMKSYRDFFLVICGV